MGRTVKAMGPKRHAGVTNKKVCHLGSSRDAAGNPIRPAHRTLGPKALERRSIEFSTNYHDRMKGK